MKNATLKKYALSMICYEDLLSHVVPYAMRLWHDDAAGVACTMTMDAGVLTLGLYEEKPDGAFVTCISCTSTDGSFMALPQTLSMMEATVDIGRALQFLQERVPAKQS
jgi:hypothetical protein